MEKTGFIELKNIFETLLGPEGCPWDKKQTHESLIDGLREEVEEFIQAVKNSDAENMKEELGDILLNLMLQAQIASAEGAFDIEDVIDVLAEKLKRRHPHVFGTERAETADEVIQNWNKIKADEKKRDKNKKS